MRSVNTRREPLHNLATAAVVVNLLAKGLTGHRRIMAYRAKASILGVLLLQGWAVVNGVRSDGTVGLDILTNPPCKLHVPLMHLCPEAQDVVSEQAMAAPAVAPMGEYLNHGEEEK